PVTPPTLAPAPKPKIAPPPTMTIVPPAIPAPPAATAPPPIYAREAAVNAAPVKPEKLDPTNKTAILGAKTPAEATATIVATEVIVIVFNNVLFTSFNSNITFLYVLRNLLI